MTILAQSGKSRLHFSSLTLLLLVTVVGVCLGLLARAIQKAQREHRAIQELVALGATYDDWVGWREILATDPSSKSIFQRH